jgi:hypothetical protein
MHAEQMHLLAEAEQPAPAPRSVTVTDDRRVTDTTVPVPVLYRCLACERQGHRQLWRTIHQRRTVHTSFWNPSVRKQADLYDRTWTTADGRTYRGEQPPAEPCGRCKRPTSGNPVRGRYSAHQTCDARCIYAKGPNCECSCAGANHGAGHAR